MVFALQSIAAASSSYTGMTVPPGWPWRGVNMTFPEAGPGDVKRYHAKLGINVVSLHLEPRRYASQKKVSGEEALQASLEWAEMMLNVCARLGIQGVLDISHFPLDPGLPSDRTAEFWTNKASIESILDVSRRLARRFRQRGVELGAYQILSEPVVVQNGTSREPPGWPIFLRQIIATLRSEDSSRWIVVHPGPWGLPDGYRRFTAPESNRLIWGAHMYLPHYFTHQGIRQYPLGPRYPGSIAGKFYDRSALAHILEPLRAFQRHQPGPVWIGEFGAIRWASGSEQYLIDLARAFDEYGWGWAYFSATGWHGWNPDYSSAYADSLVAAERHKVGDSSERWRTLHHIFRAKSAAK